MTKITGGIAALASVAPLLFETSWERVGDTHREYKKRIYGPLTSVMPSPTTGRLAPALSLTLEL